MSEKSTHRAEELLRRSLTHFLKENEHNHGGRKSRVIYQCPLNNVVFGNSASELGKKLGRSPGRYRGVLRIYISDEESRMAVGTMGMLVIESASIPEDECLGQTIPDSHVDKSIQRMRSILSNLDGAG